MIIQSAMAATIISTAELVFRSVEAMERVYGPQPNLRHWLHGAQAEAERVMSMPAGTLSPDGGIPKNPSS